MLDFEFCSPTRFIFGREKENDVGRWAKTCGGTRVLIVYGGGSVIRSGLLERVTRSLEAAGIWSAQLGGVQPNPRDTLVYAGIERCRQTRCDLVLGLGGGSALDTAKAIAIGAVYDGDFWDFYGRGRKPQGRLPLGTIVTLPATGSEGSNSSVIVHEADGRSEKTKRGLRSDLNRPDFSIINPELTFSLPVWQLACGISDILSHILERYFTQTAQVGLTDRLCEAVIRSVIENAPATLAAPPDYEARANLMWSSMIAHNGSLGVGRQEDWSVHALEHELSGRYDTAHGAGLAAVYPAWLQYMLPRAPGKIAQLANRVFDVPLDPAKPESVAREGIRRLAGFYRSIGLPVSLGKLNVNKADIPAMAARTKRNPDGTCGYYLPLHDEDIMAIYELAYDWSTSQLD